MRGAAGGGSARRAGRAVPRERPLVAQPVADGDEPPREIVGARDRPARAVGDVRHEPARVARPREREGVRAYTRHRVRQPVAQVVGERLHGNRIRGGEKVADHVVGEGVRTIGGRATDRNIATRRRHADTNGIASGIPRRDVRGMGDYAEEEGKCCRCYTHRFLQSHALLSRQAQ